MTVTERVEITDHTDFVTPIVYAVWARYRDYVELDDLHQEVALWWYGKGQTYLPEYIKDENRGKLRLSISRSLSQYAEGEKAMRSGYRPQDQYPYHPREILDLLPIALDPEGLPMGGHQEGPKPKGNLAEGGDILAALVDARRALHALPEDDLHFLTLADDCNYDWDKVAVRLDGALADSLRRRHARIAERMARWLSNTDHQEDL